MHAGIETISAFLTESGLSAATIPEQRAAMAAMADGSLPPEGIVVEPVSLGGRPAEWITPDGGAGGGLVLYLHGGGYCIGSLDSHRDLAGRIAVASGCTVVTVDYRLAPEHPFPAALDDAVAAYVDLLALGVEPGGLAIAGDSAGGGLTVAALLALRALDVPLPAAAVCLSPWADLTQSAPAFEHLAALDPMVSKSGLDLMAASYLGATDPRTELASPLFAEDLAGLPPILIEVGQHEVLLDDSTRLAERLDAAGVQVGLTVWPEMIHVFQAFPGSLIPESDQSIAAVGAFLAGNLDLPSAVDGPGRT
jgi:monoterpene epsilon-lactone hydrolase